MRAATLLGGAQRIRRSVGHPMFGSKYFGAPRCDCETRTREALGDHRFAMASRRGGEFGFDSRAQIAAWITRTAVPGDRTTDSADLPRSF